MSQIGLAITASGFSGKLIIRWVKSSAPMAEVGRSVAFNFPYDDVYVIPDLIPVVYIVQLWRSDDGVALDQLIKDWSIDASKQTVTTVRTYQYKVGRGWDNTAPVNTGTQVWADPVNGDTTLVDERLDGFTKDEMLVHEAGYGDKLDAEYDLHTGGGIELTGGKTFDQDVAWFITVSETQTVTLPSDVAGGAMFAGVEVVVANRDFYIDPTDNLYNKLVIANWAGTVGTIVFPDLALIPDDTHVTFNTQGGSQNYLALQFDPGDTVRFLNQDVNIIYLARCETISLYFKAGVAYIIDYSGNAIRRGSILNDYDASRDDDTEALLYADEATGVLNKSDYPGLYAFVNQLVGDAVCVLGVAAGQWSYDSGGGVFPNKRKYGIDTVAFTFRVPHLSGMTAKAGSPGVYEADVVGPHTHTLASKFVYGSLGRGNLGSATQDAVWNSGGNRSNVIDSNTGSAETRVKSYLQKPFVWL